MFRQQVPSWSRGQDCLLIEPEFTKKLDHFLHEVTRYWFPEFEKYSLKCLRSQKFSKESYSASSSTASSWGMIVDHELRSSIISDESEQEIICDHVTLFVPHFELSNFRVKLQLEVHESLALFGNRRRSSICLGLWYRHAYFHPWLARGIAEIQDDHRGGRSTQSRIIQEVSKKKKPISNQ